MKSIARITQEDVDLVVKSKESAITRLEKKVGNLNKKDFKIYKPLHSGLRKSSSLYMINNFMILVRRLMLLYSAMYMQEHAWFQVVLFAFLSLLYLAYLTFTWPFKNMQENLMLIFNVYFTLTISYLVMVINGMVVTSY